MLEGSIEDLIKIAANSATPSYLLSELGKHESDQVRSLVASNPNTPLETLKSLGGFANAIVANPVFDLLQREDADHKFIRLTLAISDKTPPEALTQLIATKDFDDACYALGSNISTPINTLANIAIAIVSNKNVIDPPFSTYGGSVFNWLDLVLDIISRPDIPESSLEKIMDIAIERNHLELLWKSIGIPKLSDRTIEKLSRYGDDCSNECAELLIELPVVNKSPKLLDNIARSSPPYDHVFLHIVKNPVTSASTLEYLAACDCCSIRNALINHPNVSYKAYDIVLFMQGKPGTPVEVLQELAENPRFGVLERLCFYPNVSSEILDKVVDNLLMRKIDQYGYWRAMDYLTYNPNSSSKLLQKMLKELEQDKNIALKGHRHHGHAEPRINKHLLQKTNRLIEKIDRRLKGEELPQTKQYYAALAIANKSTPIKDRYSYENLYQPEPNKSQRPLRRPR